MAGVLSNINYGISKDGMTVDCCHHAKKLPGTAEKTAHIDVRKIFQTHRRA